MKTDRWEIYQGLLQNQNAEEGSRIGQKENLNADAISTKSSKGMAL